MIVKEGEPIKEKKIHRQDLEIVYEIYQSKPCGII